MFKEESIELLCKVFCFLVFLLVIAFLNNVYSLLILFGYFFISSRKEGSNIVVMLYAFTLLGFAFGFINNDLGLLKLFLVIDFAYYFVRYVKKNKRSLLVSRDNLQETSEKEINKIESSQEEIKYYDNEESKVVESYYDTIEVTDKNNSYYDTDSLKDKNEIVVNDEKINEINNELKKGNLLKEEDVNLIKSHLEEKEKDDLKEQENIKYLRFANLKNSLKNSLKFNVLKNNVFKNKFSIKNNSNLLKSYKWQFKLDDINGMYVMCHLLILILAIVVE